jgi:hypothetical protein
MIIVSGSLPWVAVVLAGIAAVIPAAMLIMERPPRSAGPVTVPRTPPPPSMTASWATDAEPKRTGSSAAPVLLSAGAVLAIVGSFLAWANFQLESSPRPRASRFGNQLGSGRLRQTGSTASRSVQGLSTSEGKIALALGLALLVVAVVIWTTTLPSVRVAFAGLGLMLGVGLAVLGATTWTRPMALFDSSGPGDALRRSVVATVGAGVYFVMAGAILCLIAGVAGLVSGRS